MAHDFCTDGPDEEGPSLGEAPIANALHHKIVLDVVDYPKWMVSVDQEASVEQPMGYVTNLADGWIAKWMIVPPGSSLISAAGCGFELQDGHLIVLPGHHLGTGQQISLDERLTSVAAVLDFLLEPCGSRGGDTPGQEAGSPPPARKKASKRSKKPKPSETLEALSKMEADFHPYLKLHGGTVENPIRAVLRETFWALEKQSSNWLKTATRATGLSRRKMFDEWQNEEAIPTETAARWIDNVKENMRKDEAIFFLPFFHMADRTSIEIYAAVARLVLGHPVQTIVLQRVGSGQTFEILFGPDGVAITCIREWNDKRLPFPITDTIFVPDHWDDNFPNREFVLKTIEGWRPKENLVEEHDKFCREDLLQESYEGDAELFETDKAWDAPTLEALIDLCRLSGCDYLIEEFGLNGPRGRSIDVRQSVLSEIKCRSYQRQTRYKHIVDRWRVPEDFDERRLCFSLDILSNEPCHLFEMRGKGIKYSNVAITRGTEYSRFCILLYGAPFQRIADLPTIPLSPRLSKSAEQDPRKVIQRMLKMAGE